MMKLTHTRGLIEVPGTNMFYMTGLSMSRSERLTAFVLPVDGEPVMICPAFERDLIEAAPVGVEKILTWEEDEDPVTLVEKALKKARLLDKTIAMGAEAWYDDYRRISEALPDVTFTSSTSIVGVLRQMKTPLEISYMEAAARIVQDAIASAFSQAREGLREDQMAELLHEHFKGSGVRGGGLVQFGPRSSVPHNPTSDRPLASGDVILIDYGCNVNGYWSDISRPAVLGKASSRMKLIHATLRRIQEQALQRMRPSVACAGIDNMARSILEAEGFGKHIRHRLGHGIGLMGHEPPYLSSGYPQGLGVGNVVTVEPGVYTPGDYGIRIEDMVEVTPTGARLLSRPPEEMLEL